MGPPHPFFAAARSTRARPTQPVCRHGRRGERRSGARADSIDARGQPSPLQTGVHPRSRKPRTRQQLAVQGAAGPDGTGHRGFAGGLCHGARARSSRGAPAGDARTDKPRLVQGFCGKHGTSVGRRCRPVRLRLVTPDCGFHSFTSARADAPCAPSRRDRKRRARGHCHSQRRSSLSADCAEHRAPRRPARPGSATGVSTPLGSASGRAASNGQSAGSPGQSRGSQTCACDKARSRCRCGPAGSDVHPRPTGPYRRRQTASVRPAAAGRRLRHTTLKGARRCVPATCEGSGPH